MTKFIKQVNMLGSIARGTNVPEIDNETTLSNYWIDRSEDVLKKTSGMEPVERSMSWEREMEDWSGWSGNKDYYWNTKYKLSPETDDQAQKNHTDSVVDELMNMGDEEREYYFRDNSYKLPSHLNQHLEPLFDLTGGKLTHKQVERSRINQTFETNQLLRDKDLSNLSPDVSNESHAESIRKAMINGYTEFFVDDHGFISVPMQGKAERAINLPDSKNVTDSLISKIDWMPGIFKSVGEAQTASRQKIIESDKNVLRGLRLNLKSNNIRREHKSSIIADHALTVSDSPMNDINKDIQTVLGQDIKEGKYKSLKELTNALFQYQKEVWDTISERM